MILGGCKERPRVRYDFYDDVHIIICLSHKKNKQIMDIIVEIIAHARSLQPTLFVATYVCSTPRGWPTLVLS